MAGTRVIVKIDKVKSTLAAIEDLTNKEVLVGIPATVSHRENEEVGNAALGYIHEFGSPAANIPARPFLIPGIKAKKQAINSAFRRAAEAALAGDRTAAEAALNRAGIAGMNGAKERISSNIPPPLQPGTIRNRRRSRNTQSRRESEKQYLDLIKYGADPGAAQAEAGIVSLINTGQLRRAITWVTRKIKGT